MTEVKVNEELEGEELRGEHPDFPSQCTSLSWSKRTAPTSSAWGSSLLGCVWKHGDLTPSVSGDGGEVCDHCWSADWMCLHIMVYFVA